MLKRELILRNPIQTLAGEAESILHAGQFGGILARAGVGKTALIVQIALHAMLHGRNVVHVSLNQPVTRTNLWYREIFGHIARELQIERAEALWDEILPHRFIMTFRTEGFSVPKLEERMTDLVEQKIFSPRILIIDGLSFEEPQREALAGLKQYARGNDLGVWFSIRTHRDEEPAPGGWPRQIAGVEDLFEVALCLVPAGEEVQVNVLKGACLPPARDRLALDPATMLVKSRLS